MPCCAPSVCALARVHERVLRSDGMPEAQVTELCAAVQVYKRSFWTETFVAWSPHGSYLATMHRQGAAIWGGPSFSRLQRFSHPNVRAPSCSF